MTTVPAVANTEQTPVMAITAATSNAELIADCHTLGYLHDDMIVWDPTYGLGRFWTKWRPRHLVATDLDPAKSPDWPDGVDFTASGFADGDFHAVVFDPPYKLNGTGGSHASDAGYGVADQWGGGWQGRHALIRAGITESVRVLRPGGTLLIKCQDQVCCGKVRWQTREFADHAEQLGCRLVDALHLVGHRPQPPGRRQLHARRNYSTLLVLRLERPST